MIKIFKKFFRFSGEHRRAWYLSVVLEFLRCSSCCCTSWTAR